MRATKLLFREGSDGELDPPVDRAYGLKRSCLDLDRWIHFPSIGFGALTRIAVRIGHSNTASSRVESHAYRNDFA